MTSTVTLTGRQLEQVRRAILEDAADDMQTADGFTRATQTLVAVVYQTVNVTGLDSSLGLMFSKGPVG